MPAPQRTRPRRRPRANAASPAMDTAAGPSAGVATRTSSHGRARTTSPERRSACANPQASVETAGTSNGISAEAPRIAKPASSTAPLSGTATRFRRSAAGARRWKCSASSGPSAACAPSEEARPAPLATATTGGERRSAGSGGRGPGWPRTRAGSPRRRPSEGRWARRPRAARPRRFAASPSRSSVRPEDEDHRHHRRAQHGHVAADAARSRRRGSCETAAARADGRGPEPLQGPAQERRHHRHLRAREREHVIGARHAEGLGGLRVERGALAEHHRADQRLLAAGRQGGDEAGPRPTAGAGGPIGQPSDVAAAERLDQAGALAPSDRVHSLAPSVCGGVESAGVAKSPRRTQLRPEGHAVSFDEVGPRRRRPPRRCARARPSAVPPPRARRRRGSIAPHPRAGRRGIRLAPGRGRRPDGRGSSRAAEPCRSGGPRRRRSPPRWPARRPERHRSGRVSRWPPSAATSAPAASASEDESRAERQLRPHRGAGRERARHRDQRTRHGWGAGGETGEAARRLRQDDRRVQEARRRAAPRAGPSWFYIGRGAAQRHACALSRPASPCPHCCVRMECVCRQGTDAV